MAETTARVFPRKTNLTPTDENAYVGPPDLLTPHYDEVRISVTFTYDKSYAEQLADQWNLYADKILLGGIAYGDAGTVFTPREYVKFGGVMTSRGCPNACFFCDVPDREGDIRELPITMGWNLLDSNILACSEEHIRAVFEMFKVFDTLPRLKLVGFWIQAEIANISIGLTSPSPRVDAPTLNIL